MNVVPRKDIMMKMARTVLKLITFFTLSMPLTCLAADHAGQERTGPDDGPTIETRPGQDLITLRFPILSPLFEETPLAQVNGEEITLSELNKELMIFHAEGTDQETTLDRSISGLLERMINLRLIVEEARNIGLDELPDIREQIEAFEQKTLRDLTRSRRVKGLEPDDDQVEKLYDEMKTQYKLNSLFFQKEFEADKAAKKLAGDQSFAEVTAWALEEKVAQGGGEGRYFSVNELLPQVAEFAQNNVIGAVSPVMKLGLGFAIFTIEDQRIVESEELRAKAYQTVKSRQRQEELDAYFNELKDRFVTVDQELFDSLDYETEGGSLTELESDERVLATVRDEEPITVGMLTRTLKDKLYHGAERESARERMAKMKEKMLENMLYKRVFRKEALLLSVDHTEQYRKMVADFEQSILFDTFIKKVIAPDAKVQEEEAKAYYQEHRTDYTTPKMYRLKALAFNDLAPAEDTLDKLRRGTDFKWLSANAEGQVAKDARGLLQFENMVLSQRNLPADVQDVVAGAKAGDFRLYQSPEGYYYIIAVVEVYPSEIQPYSQTRQEIGNILFREKIKEQIEEWGAKLKDYYDVEIYLVTDERPQSAKKTNQ